MTGKKARRSDVARAAGDPRAVAWPHTALLDDDRYREWGLWSVVTANVSAWHSADTLLRKVAADALLMQEHHVVGQDACDRHQASSACRRWRASLQPAAVTHAGGHSAGVGVVVARHTGLALDLDFPSGPAVAHRVQVRHWGGLCPGGVHLVCVYLYDGEGLSRRNMDLLQELAFVITHLRGPWLCGGDFNMTPTQLEESG